MIINSVYPSYSLPWVSFSVVLSSPVGCFSQGCFIFTFSCLRCVPPFVSVLAMFSFFFVLYFFSFLLNKITTIQKKRKIKRKQQQSSANLDLSTMSSLSSHYAVNNGRLSKFCIPHSTLPKIMFFCLSIVSHVISLPHNRVFSNLLILLIPPTYKHYFLCTKTSNQLHKCSNHLDIPHVSFLGKP